MKIPDLPKEITPEQMQKLIESLSETLNVFNKKTDEIEWERIIRNIGSCLTHHHVNFLGILMKEKMKLAECADYLAKAEASSLVEAKKTRAFEVDAKGMMVLTKGAEMFRVAKQIYDKQKAYVEFIEGCCDHIKYYPNGVNAMVNTLKAYKDMDFA